MSAQRSKAASRSLLAILCIALITIALLHLYEPDAERIQSLAAPTPAELETILRAAPPEIQGRALALDEIVQASQMTIPGSTEPITDLPWFAVRLKEAVRYVHQGDALLQRYSERPEPSSWPDASREAYLQYVHAFTEARRARVAHGSLDIFGVLTYRRSTRTPRSDRSLTPLGERAERRSRVITVSKR